ncbi:MAG: CPBP family intramembrane metalloprotease [Gemmatimonadaceae bacterium]|nr:CPBP family intramembrane metalloprotease [Gemmatimonadaceae bacterium]
MMLASQRSILYAAPGRLRAPWRLLVWFGASAVFAIPALFARTLLPATAEGAPFDRMWESLALTLAVLAGTWYALRRVDQLPWGEVWLDRDASSPGRLVLGWMLGMVLIAVPSLLLVAVGWLRFVPMADDSSLALALTALLVLAPAAFLEELIARGYVLHVLRGALGWWPAIVLTSAGFGLLHWWNPGATPFSLGLVTLAGIFLGVVVMVTRSLWAATLAHLAWNWTMAALLHAPVSGLGLGFPDYRLVDAGPDWATGGSWGPEGGAGAAAGMIIGAAYLYARRQRRREETQ